VRAVLLAILLAACGGHGASGPAWPKSAGTDIDPDKADEDGGESLDPHLPAAVASVEASSEPEPEAPAIDPLEVSVEPTPDTPETEPTTSDDDLPLEEIVIEVNGD